MTQTKTFWFIEFRTFEIVSNFGFRDSDLKSTRSLSLFNATCLSQPDHLIRVQDIEWIKDFLQVSRNLHGRLANFKREYLPFGDSDPMLPGQGAAQFDRFEPREFIAQGDRVVVLGYYSGKGRTTGRSFGTNWAMVFTVKEGKVTGFHEYFDTENLGGAFT